MQVKHHQKIAIAPIISLMAIIPLTISLFVIHSTSALTYQSSTDLTFTLNPTISVSLSGNLTIDNLSPGDSSDSNIITVNVATNASHGYYLAATVGDSNTSSTNHNTSLTHSTNSSYKFTSLSSNVSALSSFIDDQWGYSYCTNTTEACSNNNYSNTNWVSGNYGSTLTGYNGLPLDNNDNGTTGITLLDTTNPVVSSSIKFKIGARASNTQASGTYTNTINFYAVTNPDGPTLADVTYMQDVTSDMVANTAEEMTFILKDKRDEQSYTVAKLKDGKLWMTSNLNLAGGTALSADTTDVSSEYINNFTTSGNLTKSGNTIILPTSSTEGFSDNSTAYTYNSDSTICGDNSPCYSYYSWIAATLSGKQSDGATAVADYHNAPASICPKNWRLPTSTTSNADALHNNKWKTGDWYGLATQYGADLENNYRDDSGMTGANFYDQAGPNSTVPNFLFAGYYASGSYSHGGSRGFYWSAAPSSSSSAYLLSFSSTNVASANYYERRYGFSVRCLYSSQ